MVPFMSYPITRGLSSRSFNIFMQPCSVHCTSLSILCCVNAAFGFKFFMRHPGRPVPLTVLSPHFWATITARRTTPLSVLKLIRSILSATKTTFMFHNGLLLFFRFYFYFSRRQIVDGSYLEEGVRFELTRALTLSVFRTDAISLSAILPLSWCSMEDLNLHGFPAGFESAVSAIPPIELGAPGRT